MEEERLWEADKIMDRALQFPSSLGTPRALCHFIHQLPHHLRSALGERAVLPQLSVGHLSQRTPPATHFPWPQTPG